MKNWTIQNNNMKGEFYKKLDQLHMDFLDFWSRKHQELIFQETEAIREFAKFVKDNYKMEE